MAVHLFNSSLCRCLLFDSSVSLHIDQHRQSARVVISCHSKRDDAFRQLAQLVLLLLHHQISPHEGAGDLAWRGQKHARKISWCGMTKIKKNWDCSLSLIWSQMQRSLVAVVSDGGDLFLLLCPCSPRVPSSGASRNPR